MCEGAFRTTSQDHDKMFSKLSKSLRSKKSSSQTSAVDPPILEQSHGSPSRATAPQSLTPHLSPRIDILSSAATKTTAGPAVISEGQNYGIKQLYDGGTDASIDIVFVHGLTGNAYNTWLHKDTKIHWPSALLKQDIPDARVLSFGYDADIVGFWNPASNSRLSNHAENMVGALVRKRERTNTETRRLLFVAHNLGGLVVEYALNHSRSAAEIFLRQIEKYTTGIAFLGVPHFGADLAAWGRFGTSMVNVLRRANQDIVAVLEPGSEILRVTEKTFRNNLSIRKDEAREISITCFYEELPVFGVGEVRILIHDAVLVLIYPGCAFAFR